MPIYNISSIWYPVADFAAALRFYTGALGLSSGFVNEESGIAALSTPAESAPFFLVRKPDVAGLGGGGVIGFNVTEVDEMLQSVVSFGGRIDDTVQAGAGVRIHTVYDPDGNAVELTETVAA